MADHLDRFWKDLGNKNFLRAGRRFCEGIIGKGGSIWLSSVAGVPFIFHREMPLWPSGKERNENRKMQKAKHAALYDMKGNTSLGIQMNEAAA